MKQLCALAIAFLASTPVFADFHKVADCRLKDTSDTSVRPFSVLVDNSKESGFGLRGIPVAIVDTKLLNHSTFREQPIASEDLFLVAPVMLTGIRRYDLLIVSDPKEGKINMVITTDNSFTESDSPINSYTQKNAKGEIIEKELICDDGRKKD